MNKGQITIDGRADDWLALIPEPLVTQVDFEVSQRDGQRLAEPEPAQGDDFSLRVWAAWTPRYIYGFVWRRDDIHINQLDPSKGSSDPPFHNDRRRNDSFLIYIDADNSGLQRPTDPCADDRSELEERFGLAGKIVARLDLCEGESFMHEFGQSYTFVPQAPDGQLYAMGGINGMPVWPLRPPWVEAAGTLQLDGDGAVSTMEFRAAHWDWLLPRTRGPEETPHTVLAPQDTVSLGFAVYDYDRIGSPQAPTHKDRQLTLAFWPRANQRELARSDLTAAWVLAAPQNARTTIKRQSWGTIKRQTLHQPPGAKQGSR
ncbi:MAG: hypothetical protein GKR89_36875 [Candidatus Latescibacteria bacterium]|nr:hypothetical protein [Candidatus Latescibacterota bacterium]